MTLFGVEVVGSGGVGGHVEHWNIPTIGSKSVEGTNHASTNDYTSGQQVVRNKPRDLETAQIEDHGFPHALDRK